ncbi:MAG: hypothetical protein GEU98_01690 [Pseudonocardiaceae bacterium]|nr:hypothetical protein [Pseudonocardiaceae bacterium]
MLSTVRRRTGAADRTGNRSLRWPLVCTLALIIASEYKLRVRADDQTVSGDADPFILIEIGVYALVAAFLFLRFRPTFRTRRADWVTYLGYAYAAVLIGAALYSPYHAVALVRAAQVCVVFALSRAIARHAPRESLHRIAHGFVVLVAGSVVFGFLVPFPRLESQPDRFTWLYLHPVVAGTFLAIACVLITAYLVTHRIRRIGPHWRVSWYFVLLAVCVAGLIATKTRGAVFGAAVGVLVVLWTRWRGSRKLEVGMVLGALGLIAGLAAPSMILEFFVRGESTEQLASLNSRTELWAQAFTLAGERPLYGYGLTASRGLFLDTIGLGGGHNAFVNLLVDTGVIGVLAWLALVAAVLITATRRLRLYAEMRVDRIIILAVLSAMLANSIFTEDLGAPATVASTWLFVLLAWVTSTSHARTHELEPR